MCNALNIRTYISMTTLFYVHTSMFTMYVFEDWGVSKYVAANAQHGMCALVRWLHNIQNVKWAKNRPTVSYVLSRCLNVS